MAKNGQKLAKNWQNPAKNWQKLAKNPAKTGKRKSLILQGFFEKLAKTGKESGKKWQKNWQNFATFLPHFATFLPLFCQFFREFQKSLILLSFFDRFLAIQQKLYFVKSKRWSIRFAKNVTRVTLFPNLTP